MIRKNTLLDGSITGALLRFALPILLANLLQMLYSAIDLLIIGNYATTADLAGVAISSQLMLTVTLGVSGLTTGLTVLLGQLSGAGQQEDIRGTFGTAAVFFTLLSVVLTASLIAFSEPLLQAMHTPPEAMAPAKSFLVISAGGTIFIVGYNVVSSAFRGLGDSKAPLLFVAAACAVNFALDMLFVKGLHLGATGAALATVSAQAMSLVLSGLFIHKREALLRVQKDTLKLQRRPLLSMLKLGGPIALQEILINFSFMVITAVVNTMGVVPSAAVGTVEKVMGMLAMPSIAMSMAVATVSAHNIGAGQYARAKKCLWAGVGLSLIFAAVATGFCWLRSMALPSIFSSDSAVRESAALYLRAYVLDCLGIAVIFNFNGYFSSLNKSVFSMAHSLITTFLIRVPFVLIAGATAGVTLFTIGLAAPFTSLGSIILCTIYYRRKSRHFSGIAPQK